MTVLFQNFFYFFIKSLSWKQNVNDIKPFLYKSFVKLWAYVASKANWLFKVVWEILLKFSLQGKNSKGLQSAAKFCRHWACVAYLPITCYQRRSPSTLCQFALLFCIMTLHTGSWPIKITSHHFINSNYVYKPCKIYLQHYNMVFKGGF